MAKATVRSGLEGTRTLKYTNASAVADGDILVLNGQVLVAQGAWGAAAAGIYAFRGRVEFPKEASLAVAPGEVCYYVSAAGSCNKTASGNTMVGIAVEASATTDTTVTVELKEN